MTFGIQQQIFRAWIQSDTSNFKRYFKISSIAQCWFLQTFIAWKLAQNCLILSTYLSTLLLNALLEYLLYTSECVKNGSGSSILLDNLL